MCALSRNRSENRTNRVHEQRRGFTLVELLVVLAIIGILIALILPARRGSREAGRRTQCRNNLKQIALALHNYHDTYGAFPPAYTVNAEGQPLHSWRTLILPYLDQKPRYDALDLSKAWDDPRNADAFKGPVPIYACPSSTKPQGMTLYQAVVTSNSCLRNERSASLKEITDGSTNTLLVIEVDTDHAVPWMSPNDADEAVLLSLGSIAKPSHVGGVHAAFVDGSVKFIAASTPAEVLRAIVTIDGKDDAKLD